MPKTSLDQLPVKNGFRLRGTEMTRLETFVDAAFAFALTLLVISFDHIPESADELFLALKEVPAFAASFALIVMLWVPHRNWSKRFGLDDGAVTIISFILVFVVLVYVLPLRVMMGMALSQMTGGWAPSNFALSTVAEARTIMVIYGTGFASGCYCISLLYWQAARRAEELQLNALEKFQTRASIYSWLMVGSAGIVGILIALLAPEGLLWLGGWCYSLLAIIMPVYGRIMRKKTPVIDG